MKTILSITGIAILLLVGGVWWSNSLKNQQLSAGIEGLQQFTRTDRAHVQGEVAYDEMPPVGGRHNPVWAACNGNVYDEPVINEQAVHSLEHGAVWITYSPDLPKDQIELLKDKVRGYTLMSPFPGQTSPIMLTAWGNQLALASVDDSRIDTFLRKFRQGAQTPEPGATCNAVPGGMN